MLKLIPPGKRKGNPCYLVRGSVNGTVYEYSTGTTDKAEAKAFLDRLTVEVLTEQEQASAPVSFADAADRYMNFRDPTRKDRSYIEALKRAIGDRIVTEITPDDVIEAARILYPQAISATLNRQVVTPASAILHYAAESGLCQYRRIKRFKEPRSKPRAVEPSVMEALVAHTDGMKRALIVTLFCQGLRIMDTLRWEWSRVDLRAKTVAIHVRKTDEWVTVHLHDDVVKELRAVPAKKRAGHVFPWRSTSGVYKWLRPLCKTLKVRFTPHQARHSFATWRLNKGISVPDLMEAGNWRDPKSLLRYGRVQSERAKRAVNAV